MTEIKNSILSGISFGFLLGLFFAFQYGIQCAMIAAPISGLFFGIGIYFFVTSKTVKRQTQIENTDGKEIIHLGGANHFKNGEAVGGKLYLMKDKLQFKSHSFNIQNHGLEIPLEQISQIQFFNIHGLVPKGLEIQTYDGKIEKFVVGNRKKWREEIEKNNHK